MSSLRDQIAEKLKRVCGHFQDDPDCADLTADAVRADIVQPELATKDAEIERLTDERDLARKSRDEHANRLEVAERMRPADYYQQLDEIRSNIADERVAHAAREHALASAEATLREVLAAFATITGNSGAIVGYHAPPIHPSDFARWRSALDPPKETP